MPPLVAWQPAGPAAEGGQKRSWAEISEEELFSEEAVAYSSSSNPDPDVTMGGLGHYLESYNILALTLIGI